MLGYASLWSSLRLWPVVHQEEEDRVVAVADHTPPVHLFQHLLHFAPANGRASYDAGGQTAGIVRTAAAL